MWWKVWKSERKCVRVCVCLVGRGDDRGEMRDRGTSGGVWIAHTFMRLHVRDNTTKESPAHSNNIIIKSVINTIASIARGGLAHRSVTQRIVEKEWNHIYVHNVCLTHTNIGGKQKLPQLESCTHIKPVNPVNYPAWNCFFLFFKTEQQKKSVVMFTRLL